MAEKTRTEKAQKAFQKNDKKSLKNIHTKQEIKKSLSNKTKERGQYIGDFVYGGLDGIITTFAVVSGVEGAGLSSSVLLILGFANLFADGISMSIGNYLSTKSELEYIKKEMEREKWEIENHPEGEKEELRQIYIRKGFSKEMISKIIDVITSNKKVWLNAMMEEELKLTTEDKTPVKSALVTFSAFFLLGLVPLLTFLLQSFGIYSSQNIFITSVLLTGITLFALGAMKTFITGVSWFRSGMEMLIVGGLAATVAYYIGYFLQMII